LSVVSRLWCIVARGALIKVANCVGGIACAGQVTASASTWAIVVTGIVITVEVIRIVVVAVITIVISIPVSV
jgi:hypothetical protein